MKYVARWSVLLFATTVGFAGAGWAQVDNRGSARIEEPGPPQVIHRVNPRGLGLSAPGGATTPSSSPISYHGGPVINTPAIYIVWYGNWNQNNGSDTAGGQQIIRDFAASVSNSSYFAINKSYSNASYNALVSGAVSFSSPSNEYTDKYSRGNKLRDQDIRPIITAAITAGKLPNSPSGIYFVLTSSDVSIPSGFCNRYCGWHTSEATSVGRLRYSFVGNANRCLSSCTMQAVGPNGNAAVDGMISVLAHELEEATTDPDLNAWYDSSGQENADKCAWTFGHFQYQVANGAWANVHLGTRDYLIQRNLSHNLSGPNGVGDYCMMDATHN